MRPTYTFRMRIWREGQRKALMCILCVAMAFHLLKASNNRDQIFVAERRLGGESIKLLVVRLRGHVLGWR
jgi:hypothetical protein